MRDRPTEERDRRSHPRADVLGLASAVVVDGAASYLVANLSAGGALLVGDRPVEVDTDLWLDLRMPGTATLRLLARVLRHVARDTGEHRIAVRFVHVSADEEDLIQQFALQQLELQRRARFVLVVDDEDDVLGTLVRDLRALGCRTVQAKTPLDVVAFLPLCGVLPGLAIVDLHLGTSNGADVLQFLAVEYPDIKRVIMSGKARPPQLGLALATGLAHETLSKPWNVADLSALLEARQTESPP